jgi:hypothetical protein
MTSHSEMLWVTSSLTLMLFWGSALYWCKHNITVVPGPLRDDGCAWVGGLALFYLAGIIPSLFQAGALLETFPW